jgi:hypothetical protein
MPRWLERASEFLRHGDLEHFTLDMLNLEVKDLLNDSCFYLSAGADITPIVAFKDLINSYVLCDKDLVNSIQGIDNRFNGILIRLKDKLLRTGFLEIQKFNLDKQFLNIRDRHYEGGYTDELQNCEVSFWHKDKKIYCILYINFDNTFTFIDLYLKNNIIPKAICEILPDGGSMTDSKEDKYGKLKPEEKKKILPEFTLGHMYSIGDIKQYEELPGKVEYFGDYGPLTYNFNNLKIFKKKV